MNQKIKEKILEAIKNGRIKMRPKWYFILKTALGLAGGAIILLVILYLASLVIFILRQTGVWFGPGFGPRGWRVFFVSLPWLVVIAILAFIFILEILVKCHAFAYRRPLLYSVLGILILTVMGGFTVAQTSWHGKLFRYVEKNRPPLVAPFYRREFAPKRLRNIHQGRVISISGSGFNMRNRPGEILDVAIASSTRILPRLGFTEGDEVVVFGERQADKIWAFGVRKMGRDIMK
ncbi:MAG: hypothetical protein HYT38_02780 [Candidatus Sungbacteria bacterium]|uniref:Uncharacterized protein n=1 Tax=Candidatus Sungiibacteriota bacterium TaxID=2750080 RepID=A0A931YDW2_9BACT|nr:hypothetical protein [Candidatus Sungbacteria bacterium]MBI2466148.1 hypothetical protein [Candidatus Sungbacteria bacterium]